MGGIMAHKTESGPDQPIDEALIYLQNMEAAIEHLRKVYACFGGDDTLTKETFQRVLNMAKAMEEFTFANIYRPSILVCGVRLTNAIKLYGECILNGGDNELQ
jgi:hypothetical protein